MKYYWFFLLLGISGAAQAQWKLVWSDEFNEEGAPNPKNWSYERGFVRNQELQWYQPDNAYCRGGLLIIEARKEQKPNPGYEAGTTDWKKSRQTIDYTSTSLLTRNLHSWQYGRFKMRGRIDTRAGLWPAFWTLGVAGEWPSNGEIDIMEYYRGMLLANAAWGSGQRYKAIWDDLKKPLTEFADSAWAQKFHVWRMDWDASKIALYVDDELLNEINLEETYNRDSEKKNPFRQPHYLILNLAMGGMNGGDIGAIDFPARFEVDYVRIYQKE
ncbi:glycoside hydrolase family 16 protein [Arundinibacter roseus]|uniref:Glycoside hydrolase family 16 protein n=1 Tax=Arundinibacter roseus TaxID=2070510 RepID=A0A4R4K141_9BACT|nr:glycoside hydrolase family 16 protein [Arundinibacter roseus]TDB60853.1 glycoside hydrolase family 16 protein [Arundinibacter roseus]